MIIQTIVAGLVVLCAVVAVINYYSNAPIIIKLLTLPITIAFSIYTAYFVYEKLGAPIQGMPEGNFEYIWHKSSDGGDNIILWAEQVNRTRLYIFEYNRENMKKLEEARQEMEEGTREGVEMEISNGLLRMLLDELDDEIITDEIGSDARIKQEARQNEQRPQL